ncbi:MAG: Stk1 family PASTA domain-containing Ser/Thr kinase [Microthrixaceae bacterium]
MTQPSEVLSDRYELHRKLARGGMADVWLARDRVLDRPVAVKIMFPEFATDPLFVERFRREAKSAGNLNHPNIVGVYDWGEQGGTYFIVMEYIDGPSVAEVLSKEGPLHPRRAAEVAADVAEALGFAHGEGVIHRDIKPGNIMLTKTGRAKVTDFGIARLSTAPNNELTKAGSVMGTATYFSPEQAQGHPLDGRSDLYSLGAVLFEMLTGRPPFQAESPVAIAYKHVQERPPRPASVLQGLPFAVEAVTLRLLTKNPANRYPDAGELRDDLHRFLAGQTTRAELALRRAQNAPPPPGSTQATQVVATTPGLEQPATTAVASAEEAEPDPDGEDDSGSRTKRFALILVALFLLLALTVGAAFALLGGNGPERKAVPDVIGQQLDEARSTLEAAGFTVKEQAFPKDGVAENEVHATDPEPGSDAEEGSEVTVIFNPSATPVAVPDVVGKSFDEAQTILREAGFIDIRSKDAENAEGEPGEVLSQVPVGGSEKPVTETITLTIVPIPTVEDIPDVAGMDVDEATQVLEQAGFKVARQSSEPSNSIPLGKVIRTDPTGEAETGSELRLFVSSGPATVEVPSVEGLAENAARTRLSQRGLKASTETRVVTDPDLDGLVLSSNPAGGERVDPGTTVTLVVGSYRAPTTAPPATPAPTPAPTQAPTTRATTTTAAATTTTAAATTTAP